MKKLEDFNCEKVSLESIYGGKKAAMGTTQTQTLFSDGDACQCDGDDPDMG